MLKFTLGQQPPEIEILPYVKIDGPNEEKVFEFAIEDLGFPSGQESGSLKSSSVRQGKRLKALGQGWRLCKTL
ncbi:MAG: hypothetical protein AAGA18_01780 [Verrucomicrobiota bacterium]